MSGVRSVLITGSSRGFGKLTALACARRGWRVYATMRRPEAGALLLEEARAQGIPPESIRVVGLDVDDPDAVRRAVAAILGETGGALDAVLLNAGVAAGGVFEDTGEEVAARVMNTNYFGVLRVAAATLPALRARGGRLLVMSSDAGMYGAPGLSAYTASKFAVEGWAESIALELEPFGVSVSILEPGNFATDIWEAELAAVPGSPYTAMNAALTRMGRKAAAGAGDPNQVAEVAVAALEARRPRLRYRIGTDAKLMHLVVRLLPDSVRLSLIRRYAGLHTMAAVTP